MNALRAKLVTPEPSEPRPATFDALLDKGYPLDYVERAHRHLHWVQRWRDLCKGPPCDFWATKDAPNVVLILLDDAGFGQFSTFGGGIPAPTMDKLAAEGLRFNRFHTTALCSPTRAALTTGLNNPPLSLALDPTEGRMYWTEFAFLRRANLDGTNIEDLYTAFDKADGFFYPWVPALDTAPGPAGLGACCDRSPGMNGACEDDVLAGNCADPNDVWTPNATCDAVACVEATGACCVTDSGACSDGFLQGDCSGPGVVWTQDTACSEQLCPDPLGACCVTSTGQCIDNLREVNCSGPSVVWTRDATCRPALCPLPTGACCNGDTGTCAVSTQAACKCPHCTWILNVDCDQINCQPLAIPTVSTWGLVILSLVLLAGGKIAYGALGDAAKRR